MRAFPAPARLSRLLLCALAAGAVAGCSGAGAPDGGQGQAAQPPATGGSPEAAAPAQSLDAADPFTIEKVAQFDEPWAMAFLPDGRALVTQRPSASVSLPSTLPIQLSSVKRLGASIWGTSALAGTE